MPQMFTLVLAACLSIGYDPPSAVFSVRSRLRSRLLCTRNATLA